MRERLAFPVTAALAAALLTPVAGAGQATDSANVPTRPIWAVDGVPDTVWILVEAEAASQDRDRGKELLKEAESHARAAVEGHEEDVGRRFALAVVLGLRADREGGRTKVRTASELNRELDAILELDTEHARARHILGRLHAGVLRMNGITRWLATNLLGGAELKKATWEEAERNLLFAEERVPDVAEHHLQLARLYLDTDRDSLAREEIEHVLTLPADSPMARNARAEALELRERTGGPDSSRDPRPDG